MGSKNRRVFLDTPWLTGLEKSAIQSLTEHCPFKNVLTHVNSVYLCSHMSSLCSLANEPTNTIPSPSMVSSSSPPYPGIQNRATVPQGFSALTSAGTGQKLLASLGSLAQWLPLQALPLIRSSLFMSVYQGAKPEEGLLSVLPQWLLQQVEGSRVITLSSLTA